jgi:hypothetical protein
MATGACSMKARHILSDMLLAVRHQHNLLANKAKVTVVFHGVNKNEQNIFLLHFSVCSNFSKKQPT